MSSNIVIAKFENGESVLTDPIWQWNYGQVLRIQGLRLPRAVEVHFAMGNTSKTRIGTTVDGVTDVVIPDSLLEQSGRLRAYVYLHTGEDDGETEYDITVPVKARAEPEEYDPGEEMTALAEAIALLQDDLEQTGADRAAAEEAKADAVSAKNDAVSAKNDAVSAKNDAVGAKDDAVAAKNDAVAAKNDAVSAKDDAVAAKEGAVQAYNNVMAVGFYVDEDGDVCQ